MRRSIVTRALVALLAGAVLAACSGDDGTSDGTSDGAEDGEGAAGAAAVTAVEFAFTPASVDVGVGGTVTWTNEDGVGHTVTAGTPDAPTDAFDEPLAAGDAIEITLDEEGTVAYFCSIHPSMTGEVVVG